VRRSKLSSFFGDPKLTPDQALAVANNVAGKNGASLESFTIEGKDKIVAVVNKPDAVVVEAAATNAVFPLIGIIVFVGIVVISGVTIAWVVTSSEKLVEATNDFSNSTGGKILGAIALGAIVAIILKRLKV